MGRSAIVLLWSTIMNARGWVVLLAGSWLCACESQPHPIGPLPRGNASLSVTGNNFIAFYSDRSGGGDIYLYDLSAFSVLSLPGLNTEAREVNPSITPDGRFIAFQRTVFGPEDVFLYDRSTSSLVPLPGLNSGFDDAGPAITPDGRFIAFVTARSGDANWEDVLLYDVATSSLVPLPGLNTNGPPGVGFHEGNPSISADGNLIAFRSNRTGVMDVFLYDRTTSSLVPLPGLNDPAFADDDPSISADGRFIAFQSDRSGTLNIYLYDRNTSALVPLPGLGGPASTPSISADGRFIAFVSACSGLADVFVYDRTTSSLIGLPGLNQPGNDDHYPSVALSGSLPNPNPFELQCRLIRGIAYDAGVLWITNSAPDVSNVIRISKINAGTGATQAESNDLNWNGRGITVGGGSLWVADALADVVHRVDPSSLAEVGPPFSTPGSEPTGIAFDGSDLWLTDPPLQRIYHLSTGGTALGSFSIANGTGQGLEWESNGLWTNSSATEQSHYLTSGTIDATRTLLGLPSGTSVGDIAIGNGKVYIPAGSTIYTQDWPSVHLNHPPLADACVLPSPIPAGTVACDRNHRVNGYISPEDFPPKVVLRSLSRDEDGDPLTLNWEEIAPNGGRVSLCAQPFTIPCVGQVVYTFGPGHHVVEVTVTDPAMATSTARVTIDVPDAVILVHGWSGNPQGTFGDFGDRLGRDFTVLAFDYQNSTGCNATPIEAITVDFGSFVDALGQRAANVGVDYRGAVDIVAHSMGGLVVRSYMTSGRYPAQLVKHLVTVGTPHYGVALSRFGGLCQSSTLFTGVGQLHEMRLGSFFTSILDQVWHAAPPIPGSHFLTIAGAKDFLGIIGDNDGLVSAYSAKLPTDLPTTVGYVNCDHAHLLGGGGYFDSSACPLTLDIIKSFFNQSPAPPEPVPVLTKGMVLLRLYRRLGNGSSALGVNPLNARFAYRRIDGRSGSVQVWCPGIDGGVSVLGAPPSPVDCPDLRQNGVAALSELPQGTYSLDLVVGIGADDRRPYRLPSPVRFVITGGRPTTLNVTLTTPVIP
jgi:PGAP1-like protein/WD40-like Beta Propeller Repeat